MAQEGMRRSQTEYKMDIIIKYLGLNPVIRNSLEIDCPKTLFIFSFLHMFASQEGGKEVVY